SPPMHGASATTIFRRVHSLFGTLVVTSGRSIASVLRLRLSLSISRQPALLDKSPSSISSRSPPQEISAEAHSYISKLRNRSERPTNPVFPADRPHQAAPFEDTSGRTFRAGQTPDTLIKRRGG